MITDNSGEWKFINRQQIIIKTSALRCIYIPQDCEKWQCGSGSGHFLFMPNFVNTWIMGFSF